MSSDASPLTIEELTGQRRVLVLSARALPFRPISFLGTQRKEITRYPGNPIATMQMLGPTEEPTTIHGRWSDRFVRSVDDDGRTVEPEALAYLNGELVPDVRTLASTVDDLRRQGQQIRVTWEHLARDGIIDQFKQDWLRADIVEWEIKFEWGSQADVQTPTAISAQSGDQSDFATKIGTQADELTAATISADFSLSESISSFLQKATNSINLASDTITAASDNATGAITSPEESAREILGAVDNLKVNCQSILNKLASQPAQALVLADDIASLTLADSLDAYQYSASLSSLARSLRDLAADGGDELKANTDDVTLLDIFTAVENLDLRSVSTRYYGDSNHWRELMSYNGLTDSRLTAGMMVLIPSLGAAR